MSLRRILFILSLLAFLSAAAGGLLYFSAMHRAALNEAERQAQANLQLVRSGLDSFLSEHRKPVATLAAVPEIRSALASESPDAIQNANLILDRFKTTLDADVCYLMDQQGLTIASSNRRDPDSFVGQNFAFRPYYQQAIQGQRGTYMALGRLPASAASITATRSGAIRKAPRLVWP